MATGDVEPSNGPTIRVTKNGPYEVPGSIPLKPKQPIEQDGLKMVWQVGDPIDHEDPYLLCRCGHSDHKPFCDGTHNTIGFDGTETASTDTYDDVASQYPGTGVDMYDDPTLCVGAAFCDQVHMDAWAMTEHTDDPVVRKRLMDIVQQCPSGRLTIRVDGVQIEPDLAPDVGVEPNGPLLVSGGIPIERSDGEHLETRNRVAVCRCGASQNKPLCDGSHITIGFQG